jgi:hypothetical protein
MLCSLDSWLFIKGKKRENKCSGILFKLVVLVNALTAKEELSLVLKKLNTKEGYLYWKKLKVLKIKNILHGEVIL